MKRLLSVTALAAVIAGAAVPAFGQDTAGLTGVSVRIGGDYPTQDSTRNDSANNWLGAGVDFKLSMFSQTSKKLRRLSISVDYLGKGNYSAIPVLLNYTSGKRLYYSVGVGGAFSQFPQDDGNENNRFRFAYSGAIGYNFQNDQIPLFAEVRYFGNDQPRLAALGLYLGIRF